MTRLHLVRHASHDLLGRVLTGRMPGVGLNAGGRVEAERLADVLSARPVGRVVSSPRQRAQETAAPIASRLGLAVETDHGLDEVDFGGWTGQPFDALAARADWAAWNRGRSLAASPGCETMFVAQARAVGTVLALARGEREVVCVSHQDVIKAVVAHLLGMPLDLMARFALDPAHRCVVTIGDTVTIEAINLPA